MQQLGLNAIRVYSVDNTAYPSFDEGRLTTGIIENVWLFLIAQGSMSFLMVFRPLKVSNGLVNTPTDSINRDNPAASYNAIYLQHVFATIDAFKSYTNVVGFFSGNEVINDVNTTAVILFRTLLMLGIDLG
jgi:1,3-beta-glucanosyltransferase GAS5